MMLDVLLVLFATLITGAILYNLDVNEPGILFIPALLWLLVLVYYVTVYGN